MPITQPLPLHLFSHNGKRNEILIRAKLIKLHIWSRALDVSYGRRCSLWLVLTLFIVMTDVDSYDIFTFETGFESTRCICKIYNDSTGSWEIICKLMRTNNYRMEEVVGMVPLRVGPFTQTKISITWVERSHMTLSKGGIKQKSHHIRVLCAIITIYCRYVVNLQELL